MEMEKKKGRGEKITPEIWSIVDKVYFDHKKWKAFEIANEVHASLKGKLKPSGEPYPPRWPGVSIIEKHIRGIKKDEIKYFQSKNPEDQPWGIASWDKQPFMTPQNLPIVLRAWTYARDKRITNFSIRNAKWITRLCQAIADIENSEKLMSLVSLAIRYSQTELMAEIWGNIKIEDKDELIEIYELMTGKEQFLD
jgi:hypothetical protein